MSKTVSDGSLGQMLRRKLDPGNARNNRKEISMKANQRHAMISRLISVLRFTKHLSLVLFRPLPSPDMCIVCLTKAKILLRLLCGPTCKAGNMFSRLIAANR